MHCTGCQKEITLKNSEKRLENHSRKGTWHKIGELTEEEKIPYDYPFHITCALEALEKGTPGASQRCLSALTRIQKEKKYP